MTHRQDDVLRAQALVCKSVLSPLRKDTDSVVLAQGGCIDQWIELRVLK